MTAPARPGAPGYQWVTTDAQRDELIERMLVADRYALDTEFHRERTYFPRLALMQIAVAEKIHLVDPLAVDVRPFAASFDADAVAVLHAAQQDLDVLTHAVGSVPRHLWDTQIGAGFIGYGTPSLVSLLQGELAVSPPKGDRLTDWLRRPLTDAQCSYAASDVAHLLEVHDRILARLNEMGRTTWAEDACAELMRRPVGPTSPEDAWMRLKDVRSLRPAARAVARSVAAWRERRAMASDIPVRHVLADLAILGVAQRQPRTVEELRQARGVDERSVRGAFADELLAAVREGVNAEPPELPSGGDELERELRAALTLMSAWVSQVARTASIDPVLLATRADLVGFLSGDATARLRSGWRAEVLGDDLAALLEGRAGLTFAAGGSQGRAVGRSALRLVPVPPQSP